MNKTQETLERWCSAEGIHFESAEAEEAYKARAKRIADAVQLKVPDQSPCGAHFRDLPCTLRGLHR